MKSQKHQVLHPVAGRPLLLHPLASVETLTPANKIVVVGAGRDQVEAAVTGHGVQIAVQDKQLGTGPAVQQAEAGFNGFAGDVLILYGDVALVRAATIEAMLERLYAEDRKSPPLNSSH